MALASVTVYLVAGISGLVLVRFDHVAAFIVNVDHIIM
jgi:hypothetical protein